MATVLNVFREDFGKLLVGVGLTGNSAEQETGQAEELEDETVTTGQVMMMGVEESVE